MIQRVRRDEELRKRAGSRLLYVAFPGIFTIDMIPTLKPPPTMGNVGSSSTKKQTSDKKSVRRSDYLGEVKAGRDVQFCIASDDGQAYKDLEQVRCYLSWLVTWVYAEMCYTEHDCFSDEEEWALPGCTSCSFEGGPSALVFQ